MAQKVKSELVETRPLEDMKYAGQCLIAVSSILTATADQYAHTGALSVGAVVHASNVVDMVIDRLSLVDTLIDSEDLPF